MPASTDKKLASTVVEEALADYLGNPATAGAAWTTVGAHAPGRGRCHGALAAAKRGQAAAPRAEGPALVALELMDPKLPEAEAMIRNYFEGNAKAMPEIRMGYARALLDAQRYAEATAQLQVVTREKPELPEGWLVLGSLQLQDNQLAQAQSSLKRYVSPGAATDCRR
jgi:predicted Zn-dependent protease